VQLSAPAVAALRADRPHNQIDQSILSRLLNPWWNWAAARLPDWVAPNLLTVLGSLAVFIPTVLVLVLVTPLQGAVPPWLLGLQILGIFLFQTLDALDGKQARRTGSSSPLGNWLDHTLDVLSVEIMLVGVAATCQIGTGWVFWLMLAGAMLNGIFLHWETGLTGTLYLGNGTSITEAQCLAMVVHVAGMLLAPATIAMPMGAGLGLPVGDGSFGAWFIAISVVGVGGVGLLTGTQRVLLARRSGSLMPNKGPLIAGLLPGIAALAANAALFATVTTGGERLAVALVSALYGSRLVAEQILRNLCDEAMPMLAPASVRFVLLTLAVAGLVVLVPDRSAVWIGGYCLLSTIPACLYLVGATRALARALQVPIFRLPAQRPASQSTPEVTA
jgi:phosphatidylglycerophosphate synthase